MNASLLSSHIRSFWILLMLLSSVAPAAKSESKQNEEISQALADELHVLTQKIPSFTVSKMSATQALEQLWIKSTGKKSQSLSFAWVPYHNAPEPTIDLNLKDASAMQIISYIAELSSSTWDIRGRDGVSMTFELLQIGVADHTEVAVAMATFTEDGGKLLGFTANMKSWDVLNRLESYGIKFDTYRNPAATFNASNGKLVVIVPKDDVAYVQAIARLANRGQLTPVRLH